MNHIYRSIWSEALTTWIAVSEHSKGRSKNSSKKHCCLAAGLSFFVSTAWALPSGEQVVAGQVVVNTPNSQQMQIQQSSQQAIINWQGFSINPNETVNIQQPNASATLLNRVIGQDASVIQGHLNANGQVFLINANGVLFSKSAQIDVGGLVASTHEINNADFINGDYHFLQGKVSGVIDNQGYLRTADGGFVVLIGAQISNQGVVETPNGSTAFAVGKTVDLDFRGDGLVEVKVSDAALNAHLENKGAILADGGRVILTAKAAGQLVGTVLNSQGRIQAKSLAKRSGEIILAGGDNGLTQVSGKLDVSGETAGGKITVTGKNININNSANLSAKTSTSGTAGTIKILADKSDGKLEVAGSLDASATTAGDGGFIETSAAQVKISDTAKISTKAANGHNGQWLIDPLDFTIAAGNAGMTISGMGADLLSSSLTSNNVVIATESITTGSGNITVNAPVSWNTANRLILAAHGNIFINASMTASLGSLFFQYGQASTTGAGSDYFLNNGAKIILPAGLNFSTQKGSDIANVKNYTVITSLGSSASVSKTDLQGMIGDTSLNYALGADIDASLTSTWNPIVAVNQGFQPIGTLNKPFTGSFTGLGHTITGLTVNRQATDYIGLFGLVSNGDLSHVGLLAENITGQSAVGGLAGKIISSSILNAYATGNVSAAGLYVGGLVGFSYSNSTIQNAFATTNVTGGTESVGGLVGRNESSVISNSYATGKIITNAQFVGGLLGSNFINASVNNVYATGNVTVGASLYIGGLIGFNTAHSTINTAYATGNISGGVDSVGGLVGRNDNSAMSNVYATGNVSTNGTYVGGLAGVNHNNSTIINAYATGMVTAPVVKSYVGGLVGMSTTGGKLSNAFWDVQTSKQTLSSGSLATDGKTSEQMRQKETFAAWDISNAGGSSGVWRIYESYSTPLLRTFLTPVDVTLSAINLPTSRTYDGTVLLGNAVNSSSDMSYSIADPNLGLSIGMPEYVLENKNVGLQKAVISTQHSSSGNPQQGYDLRYLYNGTDVLPSTVTITPAQLIITADASSRVYGSANPALTGSITGFVNNESLVSATAGTLSFSSSANNSSNVGRYEINGSGLTANNGNYVFIQAATNSNALNITPATLTYIAETSSRVYGAANPAFTGTVTGFVNNESLASATVGTLNFSSSANNNSNVGSYAITGSGLAANNGNYVFIQAATNANALNITPATLTYTADIINRVYGTPNPSFTGSVTGFVNNESLASATVGTLSFSSLANNNNVGSYAINGSGLTANNGNYLFIQAATNSNALNITPATLTYIADASSRVHGTENPTFTGKVTGFVNNESLASATVGTLSFSSSANSNSNVGSYAINGSGLSANNGNYLFIQAASNATALTITADAKQSAAVIQAQQAINNANIASLVSVSNNTTQQSTIAADFARNSGGSNNNDTGSSNGGANNSQGTDSSSTNSSSSGSDSSSSSGEAAAEVAASSFGSFGMPGNISGGVSTDSASVNMGSFSSEVVSISSNSSSSGSDSSDSSSSSSSGSTKSSSSTGSNKSAGGKSDANHVINNQNQAGVGANLASANTQHIVPTLSIKNSAGRVRHLQISTNNQFLSLWLNNGSVLVWDFQRGLQRRITASDKNHALIGIGDVDNNGELLAIASKAGIDIYDVLSSTITSTIKEEQVKHFVNSADNSLLFVNAGANHLSLWDVKKNQPLWRMPFQQGQINGLALAKDNRYGAVLGNHEAGYQIAGNLSLKKQRVNDVHLVDLSSGKVINTLSDFDEAIVYMEFKNNDTLQIGLASGQVLDWEIKSNVAKKSIRFADPVVSVDTSTEKYSYVTKDNTVKITNAQGEVQLSIQNKDNPFQYATLIEDGKKLLTAMTSGDLAVWDVASGKKLLRLFSTKQGWAVLDALGRFDGSKEAFEDISWTANAEDIPLDGFSDNYYEPGLLASIIQNQDFLNNASSVEGEGISLPPKAAMQLAEQQGKDGNIKVQLDVYDRGGGIDKINIYQNGKLLSNNSVIVSQKSVQETGAEHRVLTLNVTPTSGKNTLKTIASNAMGIEMSSPDLSFDGKTKAYASSLKLLTVGVAQYHDSRLNLEFSVADADLLKETIKNHSNLSISKTLYNENATKAKILAELKDLSQGVQQDVLVIYFAGHGIAVGKEWYFLPYETKLQQDEEKMAQAGVTATELSEIFKNSKIQHILLLVDACYSGAGMGAFNNMEKGQNYATRQLSRTLGITVLTAASKDQEAFELSNLGHGLFTYLMSQELQKKDSAAPITAHAVVKNMLQNMPAFARKVMGEGQDPIAFTHGDDFVLTDLTKESGKNNPSTSNFGDKAAGAKNK